MFINIDLFIYQSILVLVPDIVYLCGTRELCPMRKKDKVAAKKHLHEERIEVTMTNIGIPIQLQYGARVCSI